MSTRRRITALLVGSGVLIVIGVTVYVTAPDHSSFGWFAYSPLPDAVVSPQAIVVTDRQLLGGAIGLVGVIAAAVIGGFVWGRRPRP